MQKVGQLVHFYLILVEPHLSLIVLMWGLGFSGNAPLLYQNISCMRQVLPSMNITINFKVGLGRGGGGGYVLIDGT
jgi:hypothetical protein